MKDLKSVKVGDLVMVKSYDDIRQWEKVNCSKVPFMFTEEMRYLCGNEYTVADIKSDLNYFLIKLEGESSWNISLPMLECIVDNNIEIDENSLMIFLD